MVAALREVRQISIRLSGNGSAVDYGDRMGWESYKGNVMQRMNHLFIMLAVLAFMITTHSCIVYADSIILKSGRQILCSNIVEKKGMIQCTDERHTVSFPISSVQRILIDEHSDPETEKKGFKFDIWHSGMSIFDMVNVAEMNDVPIHWRGLITSNKHYNPKSCRDYIHTKNEFCYNDHLMGKPAKVTLYFTPQSRLLVRVEVHLFAIDINRESSYPKEIKAMLVEKYGSPVRAPRKKLFHDSYFWKVSESFTVLMKVRTGSVDIIYEDLRLAMAGKSEENVNKETKKEAYQRKDADKF